MKVGSIYTQCPDIFNTMLGLRPFCRRLHKLFEDILRPNFPEMFYWILYLKRRIFIREDHLLFVFI